MNKDVYRLIADKGEGNDSELANVLGQLSHVRKDEKKMIKDYGSVGELLTLILGSGKVNEETGLPGYDWKKNIWGEKKKSKNSPHNKSHYDYRNSGGQQGRSWEHKTGEEVQIENQEREAREEGAALLDPSEGSAGLDPETGESLTIGEMGLGQEALTAEQYQGMNPQEIVDDIFAKEYNNIIPPDMKNPDGSKMSEKDFKAELAGRLKNMPQFKGADPEALGFQKEAKDIAERKAESSWDATKYGLQGQVGKIAGAMGSVYGGSGVGMRAGIAGQGAIKQGFGVGLESRDIALDTADLGYRTGVYGLEQQAGADWEKDYGSFLGGLPSATG